MWKERFVVIISLCVGTVLVYKLVGYEHFKANSEN
jgi:hypothetical protein